MPKVTEEHRQAMRARIQEAALACFARKGFGGASMADIIKEAGLSAGAVYIYYPSKAALTIDVGRRVMEQRVGGLGEFPEGEEVPPPHVVFPNLLASIFDDHPFAPLILQVWGEASHAPGFASLSSEIFGELLGHFESYLNVYFVRARGLGAGEAAERARLLAPAVLSLMQGSIVQASILGEESQARVSASLEALLESMG